MKRSISRFLIAGFISIAWSALAAGQAGAVPLCEGELGGSKIVDELIPVPFLALSQTVTRQIENHPIYQLRKSFQSGEGLTIYLDHYETDPHHLPRESVGEWTQSHFLAKILKHILPFAKIRPRTQQPSTEGRPLPNTFSFYFTDPGESHVSWGPLIDDLVPMTLAKAANRGLDFLDKEEYREIFGLGADARVASLYLLWDRMGEEAGRNPDIDRLIGALLSGGYKTVFLSTNSLFSIDAQALRNYFPKLNILFDHIVPLSQLKVGEMAKWKDQNVLVYNDGSGVLPYVHLVSDIAVVKGPINFFEPISVRTPVLIFNNTSTLQSACLYDPQVYCQLESMALQTGWAKSVDSLSELQANLQWRPKAPPDADPALNEFLDLLKSKLLVQAAKW